MAVHGLGDACRSGSADVGVLLIDVGAVERLVVDAEPGVKGEFREKGERSWKRADLGGTSGGVLPDRNREFDGRRPSRCG